MPGTCIVVPTPRPNAPSAAATAPTRTLPSALSCAASLASWRALNTLPAETRGQVAAAIPALEAALAPATVQAAAVGLEPLIRLIDRYGLVPLPTDPDDREAELGRIARMYREDLADLPSDLLVLAVQRVVTTHRYRNLPLPAEFRKAVAEELARRRLALSQLQAVRKFGRFAEPALPPEERLTPAQASETRRSVAGATAILRPAEGGDVYDGARQAARAESLRRAREEADPPPDRAFGAVERLCGAG